MATTQFCTFFLDKLFFGIDVLEVQEVIRYQEMTRIPLAASVIRGLINLRGQIVPALDLRERLGLPERVLPEGVPLEELYMNVIIRSQDAATSLLVDEIGDVLELDDKMFEPPPNNLESSLKKMVHGVYKLDHELLLILNTGKTINLDYLESA